MILLPVWCHKFFQTRVDQITQQLKSGISVVGDGGDLALGSQSPDHHHDSSGHRIDSEVGLLQSFLFFAGTILFIFVWHLDEQILFRTDNNFCAYRRQKNWNLKSGKPSV